MEKIDIIGTNYLGYTKTFRETSRCIILDEDKILLTYVETKDMYMIPGGGKEEGETDYECALREVEEETGLKVEIIQEIIQIDELYSDEKYVNRYYLARKKELGKKHLTKIEEETKTRPIWVNIDDALIIFSSYEKYEESQEVKHGLYLREYCALKEALKLI